MTGLPRLTLITPSYNQQAYIEHTIRSVLSQDYPNLEYLVVDGGSTDSTLEILKRYRDKLTFNSEADRGQTHAINKGLLRATGDIVGYLNSDDVLEPGALHIVGEFFRAHPQAGWVTGYCRIIDAQNRPVRQPIGAYKNFWLRTCSRSVLAVLNYISQPATFWRRGALPDGGFLDENCHYAMDYDLWLRLSQRYPLALIRQTLANFRVHPQSKGGTSAAAQFAEDLLVARRHVPSGTLVKLHALHNALILAVYHWLQRR